MISIAGVVSLASSDFLVLPSVVVRRRPGSTPEEPRSLWRPAPSEARSGCSRKLAFSEIRNVTLVGYKAAVLPGGQRRSAGSYSSHRGMPGCEATRRCTYYTAVVAIAGGCSGLERSEGRRKSVAFKRPPKFTLRWQFALS
jgi:hypothetical protein